LQKLKPAATSSITEDEDALKSNKSILINVKKQVLSQPPYRKLNSCSDLVKSSASTNLMSSTATHQILIEAADDHSTPSHKKSNESLSDYTRADFTPTMSRNSIISKAHLLKRKVGIPPPPIINSNTSIGVSSLKEKSPANSVLNSSYTNLGNSCAVLNSNYDVTAEASSVCTATEPVLSNKMRDTINQHLKNHSMSTRNLFIANFFNNQNIKMRKKFESTNTLNFSKQKSTTHLSISNESYYAPEHCNSKCNY
jgi:hypothetical protein